MDDPLRPKTVPLAAETILWFEFLLDPKLLINHLKKPNPDPSAIDLIQQFIQMSPDNQPTPQQFDLTTPTTEITPEPLPVTPGADVSLKISRKAMALKILSLKVATHLKWNLDVLEKSLAMQKQIYLLRDLCTIAFGKIVNVPLTIDINLKLTPEGSEKAIKFALTLYHRWVLRLQILKDIAMKTVRPILHNLLLPTEPMHPYAPEIPTQTSVDYLNKICQSSEIFYVFTYDTFVPLHSNSERTQQNFDNMKEISQSELLAQIYFDLVGFYLYSKNYKAARQAVNECRKNFNEIKLEYSKKSKHQQNFLYCHLDENELEGYLLACGVSETPVKLMEKLNYSLLNEYDGIIEIFKLDNREREIPLVNRRIIELDIEGATSQGILKENFKNLDMQIAALNIIRSIFENGNIFSSVDYFEKYKNLNCFGAIANGITDVLPFCSLGERNKIKEFLIDCISKTNNGKKFIRQIESIELFHSLEIEDLKKQVQEEELFVPQLASQQHWKCSSKIPRIEVGAIERQLISCTNPNAVRKYLVKLASTNPKKPLYTVNPSWQIPTPINSLLMSLSRGFLQDFAYVLMGKARELTSKNDFTGAISMLHVLKSETQRPDIATTTAIAKLGKLITWEILLVQIIQGLEEWNKKSSDHQAVAIKCKECLNSLQNAESIIPRIEIIEHCTIMLLNYKDWNSVIFLDRRLPQLELPIAIASTFIEMEKLKGNKKICRDAWDIILAIFSNTANKRNSSGNNVGVGSNSRSSPSLQITTSLYPFLKKIRDQLVFSLTISLLAKIHNILKDDTNFDINGDYMYLWPANISNPIGYNARSVSETLNWLLREALKYYPQNTCWLKLKGDLELSIGNNEAAMRCYVNSIITGTEYCSLPIQRNIIDDYIIRKMIKCCSNLGCHMQAAILCQFLDDIDYSLAFKNLSEKSSSFNDSMDAYYSCIWDATLLEFIINLHSKKGEHNRKLEAISIISNLELNANNNDEIKRESATIRKTRFLRALTKQYLP